MGAIAFSGCKNRELQNIEKIRKVILGDWNWYQTQTIQTNTGAGKKITPRSEGFTRKLRFISGGDLEVYINDSLNETFNYQLIDIDVIRDRKEKDIWLKITDKASGLVLDESSIIKISRVNLEFHRELEFIVESYSKVD